MFASSSLLRSTFSIPASYTPFFLLPAILPLVCFFFFFQAEDGIRDIGVTGVQTCALPISLRGHADRRIRNVSRATPSCRHELGDTFSSRLTRASHPVCRAAHLRLPTQRTDRKSVV